MWITARTLLSGGRWEATRWRAKIAKRGNKQKGGSKSRLMHLLPLTGWSKPCLLIPVTLGQMSQCCQFGSALIRAQMHYKNPSPGPGQWVQAATPPQALTATRQAKRNKLGEKKIIKAVWQLAGQESFQLENKRTLLVSPECFFKPHRERWQVLNKASAFQW